MPYKLLFSVLLISCQLAAVTQEQRRPPRNFAGVSMSFDGANMSTLAGFEYERQFYVGNRFVAGARANFYRKYESGNFDIGVGGYASGYNGNYMISLSQLWGTGYIFLSRKTNYSGIFFSTAFGLTRSVATKIDETRSGKNRYHTILGGVEAGPGLQFPIGKKTDFRCMLTMSFHGSQEYPNHESSPLMLVCGKMAIGF
jgi:hypothetical protein